MSSQNKLKKSNITNKISKLRDFDEPSSKFKFIIDLIKKKYNPTFIDCIFSLFLSRNKKIIFQQLSEKISIKSKNFERFFIFQRGNDKIKLRIIPDFIYDIPIDLERIIFKNKSNLIFGSFSSIYLEYYNKNAITKIKRDIIFKEILYKSSEYNGLIFNFLLQQYYINNPHLCIIREFGIITVTE
jgi:hypothetical protein